MGIKELPDNVGTNIFESVSCFFLKKTKKLDIKIREQSKCYIK